MSSGALDGLITRTREIDQRRRDSHKQSRERRSDRRNRATVSHAARAVAIAAEVYGGPQDPELIRWIHDEQVPMTGAAAQYYQWET
jgi:hypothetical protein